MGLENQISKRYERELAAIAVLDRAYYLNPCPSRVDRSNYAARQEQMHAIRSKFYAELAAARASDVGVRIPRRCRFFARRCRL